MPTLLDFVPDAWGRKVVTESGAVTRTQTGPNEIAFSAPAHMALVMFTPQPHREVALNSDRRTVSLAPVGTIEVVPAGAELFASWRVAKENILVAFSPRALDRLAAVEFQKEGIVFRPPQPGLVDQKALVIAGLLRQEFQREAGLNELCIESLITLFGAHLMRTYSSYNEISGRAIHGGLSPAAWRRVTDYIHANLSENLSVARLAQVAGLSPTHFLRAFRQTCGQAPHRYVVAQRLALAEHLVQTTDMPFAAVAKAAGFSSNSHMTATMRRVRGSTPKDVRREER